MHIASYVSCLWFTIMLYVCLKRLCLYMLCFASLVYLVMNVHVYVHICVTVHISNLYSLHKQITK